MCLHGTVRTPLLCRPVVIISINVYYWLTFRVNPVFYIFCSLFSDSTVSRQTMLGLPCFRFPYRPSYCCWLSPFWLHGTTITSVFRWLYHSGTPMHLKLGWVWLRSYLNMFGIDIGSSFLVSFFGYASMENLSLVWTSFVYTNCSLK